jgi:hypothetical protein
MRRFGEGGRRKRRPYIVVDIARVATGQNP